MSNKYKPQPISSECLEKGLLSKVSRRRPVTDSRQDLIDSIDIDKLISGTRTEHVKIKADGSYNWQECPTFHDWVLHG